MHALIAVLRKAALEAALAAVVAEDRMESHRLTRLSELLDGEANGLASMERKEVAACGS